MKKALKKIQVKHRKVPLYSILGALLVAGCLTFYFYQFKQVELASGVNFENMEKIEIEKTLKEMLAGYPIEQMIPALLEKDPKTIAFLVSIGKKESNWGKRSPKHNGSDCFNYWGYRGPNRVGSGGHSCFATPQEAVDIVGKRITYLVEDKGLDAPEKMIVWKCGSSCAGHSAFSVRKWISDVTLYFDKLAQ